MKTIKIGKKYEVRKPQKAIEEGFPVEHTIVGKRDDTDLFPYFTDNDDHFNENGRHEDGASLPSAFDLTKEVVETRKTIRL